MHLISTEKPTSVDSVGDAPTNKMTPEQFLDPQQLAAVRKVRHLLCELEEVEGLYPNRQKMGDAHPQYRTLSFRRKVDTLTLWLKVMDGLSKTLSSMSSWLGVPVILPELCQEYSQSLNSGAMTSGFSAQEGGREGGEGGGGGGSAVGSSLQEGNDIEFSSYKSVSQEGKLRGAYCHFVNRSLKRSSVSSLMSSVQKFIDPIQKLATIALCPCQEEDESAEASMRKHLFSESNILHWLSSEHASSDGSLNWSQEFEFINLPHFGRQYVQLVHIPLDVVHECLKLQLELRLPDKLSLVNMSEVSPSHHDIKLLSL